MLRAIAELAGLVRPSGNDLLFGLEHDLGLVPTWDQGWRRLCETAWPLGFVELRFTRPGVSLRRVVRPCWRRAVSSWALRWPSRGGAAVVTARKGGIGLQFDPSRFVGAVQVLVVRFALPEA
jgi:hypothetical protein